MLSPKPCSACSKIGLAGEIFAAPERLGEIARRHLAVAPPAPFVFRQAAGEIAELEQQQALVPMRFGEIRRKRNGALEALQRFVEALEVMQGNAAVDQRVGEIRLARQGAIVIGERLGRTVELEQSVAAIAGRVGIVRIERQRAVEALERLVLAAELAQGVAAVAVERRGIGTQKQARARSRRAPRQKTSSRNADCRARPAYRRRPA